MIKKLESEKRKKKTLSKKATSSIRSRVSKSPKRVSGNSPKNADKKILEINTRKDSMINEG